MDNYPLKVKQMLFDDISEMSQNTDLFSKNPGRDFSRNSKLNFVNTIKFMLCIEKNSTSAELATFFSLDPDTPSKSAFFQQRNKLSPGVFSYLINKFNSHFDVKTFKDYRLVACDGSEFNVFFNPNDPDTYIRPNASSPNGHNSLHAVTFYDLLSKFYLDCLFQPGHSKNEYSAVCTLTDRFAADPHRTLIITDRGFGSYNFYAHAVEKGLFFLSRIKDLNAQRLLNIPDISQVPVSDIWVERILTRTKSLKKHKQPLREELYKYICPSVPFDYIPLKSDAEYTLRLRFVRIKLPDGTYENLVTNLPDDMSLQDISYLYHLRWNIETSYRDLKLSIGAAFLHAKKFEYIKLELSARMVLYNFASAITAHISVENRDTKHIYQLNFSMAIKICHEFLRMKSDSESCPDIMFLISRYILPIRTGRNFARQHRFRRPMTFLYR